MKLVYSIYALFLLAVASSTVVAQSSDTIVPNPQAAQLRKVWEVTGRPLKYDEVGYGAARLPDLTGDSINEFAVYKGSTSQWFIYAGGHSPLDLQPIHVFDSVTESPSIGVGDFFGTGHPCLAFSHYFDSTGSDSIRRFPYQLWIYRTDSGVHSTPAMILDPRTIDPTLMVGIRGIEGVDVDNDSIDDLVLRVDGSSRNGKPWQDSGEVWIYKGGKEFQVEQPSVQIRSIGTMEQGTHNVSFIHLDGDQKLDMVIGARQAGGARLKFYFSDDNSPYSWANRPPDREISLYPATNLYLSHRFIPLDLDGDHRADFVGKVYATTGPPPAIYLFLSGSGKDYRTRPFTLDDADQVLPTRTDAYLWRAAGYLNDSSRRFEMLPLVDQLGDGDGMMLLSGGNHGPNRTYDAYYFSPTDGIIGRAMGPLGDVTGDAWPDMITGDERWGAFVDQGIAMVLAGGPYIPTDDPTTDVQEVPIAQRSGGLFLWPNPVRERLNIAWRGDLRPMPERFELYDTQGRYCAGGNVDPAIGSAMWERGETASGTYFLRVMDAAAKVIAVAQVCVE
ncbi:MAG: hypothetical protein JNJ94_16025 [Chlorobi bacterium]|nr:hypothetical protein [Chlorobiota bacterium]